MLQKLVVDNYAIIDHLELKPDGHLNTVTGETGAGKSIILGALSLILGDRADTSVLIKKDEKCVVEAVFDVQGNDAFRKAIQDEELDDEPQCIIRREISSSGKSRAFVNDTPVNLQVLNRLTSLLVDLHQQFGHLAFEDDSFQMDVVDAIAQNAALTKEYTQLFQQYKKTAQELNKLQQQQLQWKKDADYKQYLLDELLQVSFKENEIEEADQQLKQLAHAERIVGVLQVSRMVLDEGEQPLNNELRRIAQQLQSIMEVLPEAQSLHERVNSAWAELKDIAGELEAAEGKISMDPELMQTLQERMDHGYKLLKKHGLQTTTELLSLQLQLETDMKATLNLDEQIEKLEKDKDKLYKDVVASAKKLSAQRNKIGPELAARITELLALVGMPNAQFRIDVNQLDEPIASGMDDVEFLLDANKSGRFQPVYKAASGGEMSRIMLCVKSLTAKAMQLPTLIFDEVDTGISGEAARQVGMLLQELGKHHQVICITHQPQVAAKGSAHFYVYKEASRDGRINTNIRRLQTEERVQAIARMIGGEQPSDAALQNAKELVSA
ncbi:MAG: DNA repair protein RecN [Sphingobacteriales bacterium]|nr:MAG: DNA repair protein RecN [Sphingobacteriales bacterium]